MKNNSILLVMPNQEHANALADELQKLVGTIKIVHNLKSAISSLANESYSMIISDHILDGDFKASCLKDSMTSRYDGTLFGLITDYKNDLNDEFLDSVDLTLINPFDVDDMVDEIEYLLREKSNENCQKLSHKEAPL